MFSKPQKWAILMGIYAQVLFVVSWLGFGLIQGERYSWIKHSISDMYAVGAPHGGLLVALLTICGAMTILYIALGLWPTIKNAGAGAKIGSLLLILSIYGLGDLLSPFERLACRMADVGCTADSQLANSGGKADQLLSTIGLILFVGGIFTIGYSIRRIKDWRKASTLLIAGGYLLIPLFILMGTGSTEFGGATERLIALFGAVLLLMTAVFCYRKSESKK